MRFFSPSQPADAFKGPAPAFQRSQQSRSLYYYTLIPKHLTGSVGSFAPLR